MSNVKDGGQAFPRSYAFMNPSAGQSELKSVEGMTLRDWFAGKALPAVMDATALLAQSGGTIHDDDSVADTCYKMADAMLKRRFK